MKKHGIFIGIAVLIIAAIFTLGCKTETEGEYNIPTTNGRLTITGLGSYNGKYATAWADDQMIGGTGPEGSNKEVINIRCRRITGPGQTEAVLISDGEVELPVFKSKDGNDSEYTGSDQINNLIVNIWPVKEANQAPDQSQIAYSNYCTVYFTDGIGTLEGTSLTFNPIAP